MKFKSYLISAIVLGSSSLLSAPVMADYHCTGKNISVSIYGSGWNASYEGRSRSGTIYLHQVSDYRRGNRIEWENNRYIYRVRINRSGRPYRVQLYKPNGRRIINKHLSCKRH
jgi:hypothetical protein